MPFFRTTGAIAFLTLLTSGLPATGCAGIGYPVTIDGVCERDDQQGVFCIAYKGLPEANLAAAESGCRDDWGGRWTRDGSCTVGTLVGTCTLTGGATGDAESAIMEVYEPTDPTTAEEDICGDDGTWATP